MLNEYQLEIQCFGENEADAVERAVAMLNEGANFDVVTFLHAFPATAQDETRKNQT